MKRFAKLTIALNVIVAEIARICALVGPPEAALAMLAPLHIVPLVTRPVRPRLEPLPMLLVLLPLALILRPIQVTVSAVPVRLIVLPQSIVHIAVRMDQSSLPIRLIVGPVALVHGAILPVLHSLTLPDLTSLKPFSFVLGLVFEVCEGSVGAFAQLAFVLLVVIDEVSELLTDLHHVHALVVLSVPRTVHPRCEHFMS